MKSLKEMPTIDLDEVFMFLDQMEILEKEHRKMRKVLLKVRNDIESIGELGPYTIIAVEKALKRETL